MGDTAAAVMSSLGLEPAAMSDPAAKVIALNRMFLFIELPLVMRVGLTDANHLQVTAQSKRRPSLGQVGTSQLFYQPQRGAIFIVMESRNPKLHRSDMS